MVELLQGGKIDGLLDYGKCLLGLPPVAQRTATLSCRRCRRRRCCLLMLDGSLPREHVTLGRVGAFVALGTFLATGRGMSHAHAGVEGGGLPVDAICRRWLQQRASCMLSRGSLYQAG